MKETFFKAFIIFLYIWIFTSLSHSVLGQSIKTPHYETEIQTQLGLGSQTPYWMITNQYGKYSTQRNGLLGTAKLWHELPPSKKVSFAYGLEFHHRLDGQHKTRLHQAYLTTDLFQYIRIKAGMQEETIGIIPADLSTGSILWSANARPMPKFEISTPGFVAIPFSKGLLETHISLAHGWFEKDRYIQRPYLHQKFYYFRLGGHFPLNITYGLNHMALWGGKHPILGDLPVDLDSFRRVFFAKEGDSRREDTPDSWKEHRFGNHIGSRNYAIELQIPSGKFLLYMHDLFEDNSGRRRRNFPDGLWGFSWSAPYTQRWIQQVVYEFVYTLNQSGPVHEIGDSIVGGADNYFNHNIYQSGWTYHKMTIGTPLITSSIFNKPAESPQSHFLWNNRLRAHHLGISGFWLKNYTYKLLLTYSYNQGLYPYLQFQIPEDQRGGNAKKQFSALIELKSPKIYDNYQIIGRWGFDQGALYGNNMGIMLGISYSPKQF